ncbi:hypothetical protein PMG11_05448 [Penicillium brasilianum]|uniref:Uncharacterized protein n=1 Tax=Penicillium brasilianum TaxID=104259 RepID=A0A0F7VK89_PENBI|nr:hypothetical protein PMG11_05448 [Penicillium brasilianum]
MLFTHRRDPVLGQTRARSPESRPYFRKDPSLRTPAKRKSAGTPFSEASEGASVVDLTSEGTPSHKKRKAREELPS